MNTHRRQDCRTSYDRVADEYVRRIFDELKYKPLDRELLDRFAESVRDTGPACDMGCGPAHVARYLRERGVDVCGIDLSPELVKRAQSLNPGMEVRHGDMLALEERDEAWAGIVAFYSILHIARGDMGRALGELRRVLRPGGLLLLAFHIGDDSILLEEWWGHKVCVEFYLFRPADMEGYLRAAGFEIEETIERDPYPDVEHPSRRCYIFARRTERME